MLEPFLLRCFLCTSSKVALLSFPVEKENFGSYVDPDHHTDIKHHRTSSHPMPLLQPQPVSSFKERPETENDAEKQAKFQEQCIKGHLAAFFSILNRTSSPAYSGWKSFALDFMPLSEPTGDSFIAKTLCALHDRFCYPYYLFLTDCAKCKKSLFK